MAEISVIVPVYKVEAYLMRCVNSILSQSYGDFELILVDDGSPDRCGEICEEIAKTDSRVIVLHRENGGLSAARNTGIDWAMAHSGSQWLTFIDSDDWVDRTYLEQLHRAAVGSGCQVSVCGFYRTAGENRETSPEYGCHVMSADEFYCNTPETVGTPAVAVCKLYRKTLFEDIRYPVGRLHEDEFTTYHLVYGAGQAAVVPGALYAYFQNEDGIMRAKWSPRRMDVLEALSGQLAYAKEQNLPNLQKKAAMQLIYSAHEQLNRQPGRPYDSQLRKCLRQGLKEGRSCGVFPGNWNNLWAYEEGYPCKLFWWLAGRMKGGSR